MLAEVAKSDRKRRLMDALDDEPVRGRMFVVGESGGADLLRRGFRCEAVPADEVEGLAIAHPDACFVHVVRAPAAARSREWVASMYTLQRAKPFALRRLLEVRVEDLREHLDAELAAIEAFAGQSWAGGAVETAWAQHELRLPRTQAASLDRSCGELLHLYGYAS